MLFRSIGLGKTGADVAEVTTRKGIALALSGDYAGAKAAFEGVTTGNRAEIAKLWLLWISTKTAA